MLKQMNRSEPALHINEINVNDKYKFLNLIGKGSYGEVWLVLPLRPSSSSSNKSNVKQLVLKRLDLRQQSSDTTQNDIDGAEREAKLLSTLKHPNIVAYIESFRSNDGFLNIVMAYCEGGDLYTKLKERKANQQPLPENQIIEWFVQICMALQYIHDKSILHRDLKTQNIFLTKNEIVKVGDLGIARVLDSGNDLATTIIGTPYYMSPEIFSHQPYGQKSDIWALGCCVYEMTTLEHAFNAKDMNALVIKIIRGQTPQTSKKYSDSLTDIIKSMLSKNPVDRPTAKKILQSPFIKKHILQLLEKTKVKCQNQANSNSQVTVVAPSVVPLSSSPPRSSPSNDAKTPYSSASSPSSKKSQPNVFSNNNPPVLPSFPPLPPTHNRPSNHITTSSSSGSSSSADASGSLPSADVDQSNNARARRRLRMRQSNPLPINDKQMDLKFLLKLSENDTLQRRQRDQQIHNHLRQYQQISSDDEHDISSSPKASRPAVVVAPQRQLVRPSSAASSVESNHSKLSYDDDVHSSDRHLAPSYQQLQQSEAKIIKSSDSSINLSARQRRRDNRIQSSIETSITSIANNDNQPSSSQSTAQDAISAEIEKKKEGEKDMNDFLFMLTATLKLAPDTTTSAQSSDMDSSASTNSSNDSDRTLVDSGDAYSRSPQQSSQPWSSGDRTMEVPLHQTNRLQKRFDALKTECLREISEDKLRRVLNILENVSETQMTHEMILELGEDLYEKYASQIFLLKFYEDSLRTYS
ncbi:unnamed protein product [Adineta ricciae]|uniref:non-specific serine/threonine protein kinase n=1 Tax=Adineta ricciae TaxID=249248 RepID=A0A813ZNT4_ADIRI|nr:unnamed protein product [Adineta ricciae]CAF0900551.1 unnamed protein product [Adineta ricciae]